MLSPIPAPTARMEDINVTAMVAYLKSSSETSSEPSIPRLAPVILPEVLDSRVFRLVGKGVNGMGDLENLGIAEREVAEDTSRSPSAVRASLKVKDFG